MAYKEKLLQWIWQELQFNCSNLRTTCGKTIEIRDNGTLNNGAGPDFLGAHIFIDGLEWHGSVEVHKTANDWFRHGHQFDKNFNNVVLHVVGSDRKMRAAETVNGSNPFTLCLQTYLQKGLYKLLQNSNKGAIPCAGNVEFIHQQAFEQQVETAHKEYFEFKIDELIQFYPAGVPVIRAWKQAFIHQVYRTLGISANRVQMGELALKVSAAECIAYDLSDWQKEVHQRAFHSENRNEEKPWTTSGIRPSAKPENRVRQAAAFQYSAAMLSIRDYLQGPEFAWEKIESSIPSNSKPGAMMNRLLYYTAFIPALYLLGKLLHDTSLMSRCYSFWAEQEAFVPSKIEAPFKKAGFEVGENIKKLGLAHQYKRYCLRKNCRECKVFKNAIRA